MVQIKEFLVKHAPVLLDPKLLFLLVVYVLSGVMQPMLIETLKYQGACEKKTFLFLYPNYIGMVLVEFWPRKKKTTAKTPWKRLAVSVSVDVVAQACCYFGMVVAGSGVYTVVYASVTTWCAVLSRIFLKRKLMMLQWLGCIIVTVGIGLNAADDTNAGDVVLGVLIVLAGTFFHSLTYIINEKILALPNSIQPERLSAWIGLGGTIVFTIYMLVYTIPNGQELVIDNIKDKGGKTWIIALVYPLLTIDNLIHALVYFNLLHSLGSVTAGIMKGVQTVLVFGASHFFFCGKQESQCFDVIKGISVVVVVTGILVYSHGSVKNKRPVKLDELDQKRHQESLELDSPEMHLLSNHADDNKSQSSESYA